MKQLFAGTNVDCESALETSPIVGVNCATGQHQQDH